MHLLVTVSCDIEIEMAASLIRAGSSFDDFRKNAVINDRIDFPQLISFFLEHQREFTKT